MERDTLYTVIIHTSTQTHKGKLADAELHFSGSDATLAGLKLVGFAIWERRANTGRNVTFPARQYAVNGERRSFALLRPASVDHPSASETLRDRILDAYTAHIANTPEKYPK